MKTLKTLFVTTLLLTVHCSLTVAQCAMCRGSVQTNMSTGRNVIGNGINTGVLYLFAFPYLAVAVVAYLWYTKSKKALEEKQMLRQRVIKAYE